MMGIRHFNESAPSYVSFSQRWSKAGDGKYLKRRLNKARRKFEKLRLRGIRGKAPTQLEGEVNYRGW